MSLLARLRRRSPSVLVECRRCGTTASEDDTACPACGATDLARYELPP